MLRAVTQAAGFALLCGLPACSVAFEYPPGQGESSAAACTNRTDDDLDQLIDCDDPDCDGTCPEQDSLRCADGRDNDGDGLSDGYDARCWHLIAPEVLRCASSEPTDFEERFDAPLAADRWFSFGSADRLEPPVARTTRPDFVLGFAPDSPVTGDSGLASDLTFVGNWSAFELSFQARVQPGSRLRVALVPVALAPANKAPLEGAVQASMSVQLAGQSVEFLVDGYTRETALAQPSDWHTYRVSSADETIELSLDGDTAFQSKRPGFAASRLAIWGHSAEEGSAQIDDLHVRLAGRRPCGVVAPQMPLGEACALDTKRLERNVGLTASVAARDERGQCAVLTTGELGSASATRALSWWTQDGRAWQPGGELPEVNEGELAGAAVAYDAVAAQWRAATVLRSGEGTALRLYTSPDCLGWTQPLDSVVLPADAQSPSYLIPGVVAPFEVYFTRPDAAGTGVALWRLVSDDATAFAAEEVPVVTFGAEDLIAAPVSLTRAGPRDVVLTHRIALSSSILGLGLWVAEDDALTSWRRTSKWPLIQSETTLGGFDGAGIVSGAVAWTKQTAFVLYGARGQPVSELVHRADTPVATAGTALLLADGQASSAGGATVLPLPGACGDGDCASFESCTGCPVDCGSCDGEVLLADDFSAGGTWQRLAVEGADSAASAYVSEVSGRANLAAGERAWLLRTLETPVFGDFELSFDAHWVAPNAADTEATCTAFVGVGLLPGEESLEPDGVFVQLDQQLPCASKTPTFSPMVRTNEQRVTSLRLAGAGTSSTCLGTVLGIPELWHRVVLQRRNGKVSVSVAGSESCVGISRGVASTYYTGALQGLDRVMLGWGSADMADACSSTGAGLSIDNVVLRSLPCPDGGQECIEPDTGVTVCVDLQSSHEHCGGCFQPVATAEHCANGVASCGGALCASKGGVVTCTNLETSPRHCGACGNEVGPHELCSSGYARAVMVSMPGRFAIDATEVSKSQYADWLATAPTVEGQPDECAWNGSFEPSCAWPPDEYGDRPVVCVDWCDARAYCEGIGKRLCGAVGGGPISSSEAVSDGQWFLACSSGGINKFPYGPDFEAHACNGKEQLLPGSPLECSVAWDVGSEPSCQSSAPGYEGVFDLTGNVEEWIDSCSGEGDAETHLCLTGGGSGCGVLALHDCSRPSSRRRDEIAFEVGFRCCSR